LFSFQSALLALLRPCPDEWLRIWPEGLAALKQG
jgi:hypothetical protein